MVMRNFAINKPVSEKKKKKKQSNVGGWVCQCFIFKAIIQILEELKTTIFSDKFV